VLCPNQTCVLSVHSCIISTNQKWKTSINTVGFLFIQMRIRDFNDDACEHVEVSGDSKLKIQQR